MSARKPHSAPPRGAVPRESGQCSPTPEPRRKRRSFARRFGRPSERIGDSLLRVRVLVSSYAALNLILFFRVDPTVPKLICLSLAVYGIVDALRMTLLAGDKQAVPRTFVAVRDSGSQIAGYLATYLLPLLAAPNPDGGDLAAYAVYAMVIAIVTVRSELAHVNPTLYLLGWKVVTVTDEKSRDNYLVCRKAPRPGETARVTRLYGVLHAVETDGDARTERMGRD
jgi:hypothetical protein